MPGVASPTSDRRAGDRVRERPPGGGVWPGDVVAGLHWIGLITMVLDHSHLLLGRPEVYWAYLGRLAFPAFAVAIGINMAYHTRDRWRYTGRLLALGVVSEVPHFLFTGQVPPLNIGFSLAIGALMMIALAGPKGVRTGAVLALPLISLPLSYPVACVLLPWAGARLVAHGYGGPGRPPERTVARIAGLLVAGTALAALSNAGHWLWPGALLFPVLLPLSRWMGERLPRLPGRFLYLFYPSHLLLFWLAMRALA